MNSETSTLSHQRVELLMPAFIRGKLDSGLQRQMQEHIAACPACARRHREDLELVKAMERPAPTLELLLTTASRERNRESVLSAAAGTCQTFSGGVLPAVWSSRPARRRLQSMAWAAGLAAMLTGAVFLARVPEPAEHHPPVAYRTLSDVSPDRKVSEFPTYRVVFQPTAPLETVQRMLLDLGAVVVGGPTQAGVYTLAFPAATPDDESLLEQLRDLPQIVLAEKSVHHDG